jgi:hypothetical protein
MPRVVARSIEPEVSSQRAAGIAGRPHGRRGVATRPCAGGTFAASVRMTVVTALCFSAAANAAPPPIFGSGQDVGTTRASAWRDAAAQYHVDSFTLYALALVETRRQWSDGLVRPWPWTLHTPAEGALYFPSYEEALIKLRAVLASGEKNVDVGMLEVNWRANAYRLPDPAQLLMPKNNIAIAAQIYGECLSRNARDWMRSVACYHSPRAELGIPYATSVLKILE